VWRDRERGRELGWGQGSWSWSWGWDGDRDGGRGWKSVDGIEIGREYGTVWSGVWCVIVMMG